MSLWKFFFGHITGPLNHEIADLEHEITALVESLTDMVEQFDYEGSENDLILVEAKSLLEDIQWERVKRNAN